MDKTLIIWPMIVLALATLLLYLPMSRVRVGLVKSGKTKASVFKTNVGEPDESLQISNAIRNQYETPILFYAVCLSAYVTDHASIWMIVLAWAFMVIKLLHTAIHATTNRIRHRRPIFMVAYLVLIVMWIMFGLHLAGAA